MSPHRHQPKLGILLSSEPLQSSPLHGSRSWARLAGRDRCVSRVITRQEAHPSAREARQMAGFPPSTFRCRPPPTHSLHLQIPESLTSSSPRPRLRRRRGADPCSTLASRVRLGPREAPLKGNARGRPTVPSVVPSSLRLCPPHLLGWRLQIQGRAPGSQQETAAAHGAAGWALPGPAAPDLERKESGAEHRR